MSQITNEFGQPIGASLPDWQGAAAPERITLDGRYCRVEPMRTDAHLDDLFDAYDAPGKDGLWTYMPVGPFDSRDDLRRWMIAAVKSADPLFYTIIDQTTDRAVGMAAYLRIDPRPGLIEVGHIAYSPLLQRTPIATEAMYLMMQYVFNTLGYRRYEWKCDALNAKSRRAAERYGFTYDGLFPQAMVYRGRNRDTTWFSMLDRDWPAIQRAYQTWLDPANFTADGQQIRKLQDLIARER